MYVFVIRFCIVTKRGLFVKFYNLVYLAALFTDRFSWSVVYSDLLVRSTSSMAFSSPFKASDRFSTGISAARSTTNIAVDNVYIIAVTRKQNLKLYCSTKNPPKKALPLHVNRVIDSKLFHAALDFFGTQSISILRFIPPTPFIIDVRMTYIGPIK